MSATPVVQGELTSLGPVQAPCDGGVTGGHWLCVTHDLSFPHNLAMHSHTSTGEHVVAWVCHEHGVPEVP